ncbi:MAG: methyltransferase [Polyangiales bacterium]
MTWENAWSEGRTPWDGGKSAPELGVALKEELFGPSERNGRRTRVLVTGCGSGWDAFAFADAGFDVVGLDIAPSAGERFAELRAQRSFAQAPRVAIADFLTWSPACPFDVIWDYTFLCALPLAWRHRWATRMDELLAPDGTLATLIFPMVTPAEGYEGPPWPLHPEHLQELLVPRFESTYLAPARASHPKREGKESLGLWRRP